MTKSQGMKLKGFAKFRSCEESASSSVSALVNKLNSSLAGSNLFSKQTNNNQEPCSSEERDDQRIQVILPWINNFKYRCRSALGSKNITLFENLLKLYLRNISVEVKSCYMRPNRAAWLKKSMYHTLLFFHLFYEDIKDPFENAYYLDKMSDLISMYIDMELKASTRGKESWQKLSRRLINALYLFLDNSIEHILDAILKSKFFDGNFREITAPILGAVLNKVKCDPKNEMLYVRYILVFKLWKKIIVDKDVRNKIDKIAHQQLHPPKNFVDKSKLYFKILPYISKHKNVTLFLMQGKFDLKSACQEFIKMVDDTQQSGISTSMMMDKPIYFGNGLKISKYDQIGKEDKSICSLIDTISKTIASTEANARTSFGNGQETISSGIGIKRKSRCYGKPDKKKIKKEKELIPFSSSGYNKHKSNSLLNKSDKPKKLSSLENKTAKLLNSNNFMKNKIDQNKINYESDILNMEIKQEPTDHKEKQININQNNNNNLNKQIDKMQEKTILKPLHSSNSIEKNKLSENGVLTSKHNVDNNIAKQIACQEDMNIEFIHKFECKNKILIKEKEKNNNLKKTKSNTNAKEKVKKKKLSQNQKSVTSLGNNTKEFSEINLENKIAQLYNEDTPVLSPCEDNFCDTLPCNEITSEQQIESNQLNNSSSTPSLSPTYLSTPVTISIDLVLEESSTPDQLILENKEIQMKPPEEKKRLSHPDSSDFDTIHSGSFIIKETNSLKNVENDIDSDTNTHIVNDINYSNSNLCKTDMENFDSLDIETKLSFDLRIKSSSSEKSQTSKLSNSDSQFQINNSISVKEINTKCDEIPFSETKHISSKSLETITPENSSKKATKIKPSEIQNISSSLIKKGIFPSSCNSINEMNSLPFISQVIPKFYIPLPALWDISPNSGNAFNNVSKSNLQIDSGSLQNVNDSKIESSTEFKKSPRQMINQSIESTSLIIQIPDSSTPVDNQIYMSTSKIQTTDSSPDPIITNNLSDINHSNENTSKTDQTINNSDSMKIETELPIGPLIKSSSSEKCQTSNSLDSDSQFKNNNCIILDKIHTKSDKISSPEIKQISSKLKIISEHRPKKAKLKANQGQVDSSSEIKPLEIQDVSSSCLIKKCIFSPSRNPINEIKSLPFFSQVKPKDISLNSGNEFNKRSESKSNLQMDFCSLQSDNATEIHSSEELKKPSNEMIKQSTVSTSLIIQTPDSSTPVDNQISHSISPKIQIPSTPMINQISEPISSKSVSQISSQNRNSFNRSNSGSDDLLNLAINNEIHPDSSSQILSDENENKIQNSKANKVESYQLKQLNKGFSKYLNTSILENEKEIQKLIEMKEKCPTINKSEVKSISNKTSCSVVENSEKLSSIHPLLNTNKIPKVLLKKLDLCISPLPSFHSSKVDSEEKHKISEEKIEANTYKQTKSKNNIRQKEPVINKQVPQEFSYSSKPLERTSFTTKASLKQHSQEYSNEMENSLIFQNMTSEDKSINYIPQEQSVIKKLAPEKLSFSSSMQLEVPSSLTTKELIQKHSQRYPNKMENSLISQDMASIAISQSASFNSKRNNFQNNRISNNYKSDHQPVVNSYSSTEYQNNKISNNYKLDHQYVVKNYSSTESNYPQDLRMSPEQNSNNKDTENLIETQYDEESYYPLSPEEPSPAYEPLEKTVQKPTQDILFDNGPLENIYPITRDSLIPLENINQEPMQERSLDNGPLVNMYLTTDKSPISLENTNQEPMQERSLDNGPLIYMYSTTGNSLTPLENTNQEPSQILLEPLLNMYPTTGKSLTPLENTDQEPTQDRLLDNGPLVNIYPRTRDSPLENTDQEPTQERSLDNGPLVNIYPRTRDSIISLKNTDQEPTQERSLINGPLVYMYPTTGKSPTPLENADKEPTQERLLDNRPLVNIYPRTRDSPLENTDQEPTQERALDNGPLVNIYPRTSDSPLENTDQEPTQKKSLDNEPLVRMYPTTDKSPTPLENIEQEPTQERLLDNRPLEYIYPTTRGGPNDQEIAHGRQILAHNYENCYHPACFHCTKLHQNSSHFPVLSNSPVLSTLMETPYHINSFFDWELECFFDLYGSNVSFNKDDRINDMLNEQVFCNADITEKFIEDFFAVDKKTTKRRSRNFHHNQRKNPKRKRGTLSDPPAVNNDQLPSERPNPASTLSTPAQPEGNSQTNQPFFSTHSNQDTAITEVEHCHWQPQNRPQPTAPVHSFHLTNGKCNCNRCIGHNFLCVDGPEQFTYTHSINVPYETSLLELAARKSEDERLLKTIEDSLYENNPQGNIERNEDSPHDNNPQDNIDCSLPLKKRLKTMRLEPTEIPSTSKQATENLSSYPSTPMISIAELEYPPNNDRQFRTPAQRKEIPSSTKEYLNISSPESNTNKSQNQITLVLNQTKNNYSYENNPTIMTNTNEKEALDLTKKKKHHKHKHSHRRKSHSEKCSDDGIHNKSKKDHVYESDKKKKRKHKSESENR